VGILQAIGSSGSGDDKPFLDFRIQNLTLGGGTDGFPGPKHGIGGDDVGQKNRTYEKEHTA
jgi:hypothetical protein